MNFERYTLKAQEGIQKAATVASENEHQAIEPAHLLKGLLLTDENIFSYLFKKLNINRSSIEAGLELIINSFPKVNGQQPYLSNDSSSVMQRAEKYCRDMKDEFITVEHILLGLVAGKDKTGILLKNSGFNEKDVKTAVKELRGNDTVKDQNADGKYRSLER